MNEPLTIRTERVDDIPLQQRVLALLEFTPTIYTKLCEYFLPDGL